MKRKLSLPFLAAMILATDAFAYKPAASLGPEQRQELQDAFGEIKSVNNDLKNMEIALRRARPGEQKEKYSKLVAQLKIRQKDAYNFAIQTTIKVYEIVLPGHSFPWSERMLKRGVNRDMPVTWTPMFDNEHTKELIDEFGNIKTETIDAPLGISSSDGTSRIFPEAFTEPALLASTLLHELLHFKQFTSPEDQELTPAQREVVAYKYEAGIQSVLGFSKDGAEEQKKRIKLMLAIKSAKAAEDQKDIDKAKAANTVFISTEVDVKSGEELFEIQKSARALREKVEKEETTHLAHHALDLIYRATKAVCAHGKGSRFDDGPKQDLELVCRGNKGHPHPIWPGLAGNIWLYHDDREEVRAWKLSNCEYDVLGTLTRCPSADTAEASIREAARHRREKAWSRHFSLAKSICDRRGMLANPNDETDHASICADWDKDFASALIPAVGDECIRVALASLEPCSDPNGEMSEAYRAIQVVWRKRDQQELRADSQALMRFYRDEVGICDKLCENPSTAWDDYDDFCKARKQVHGINAKYSGRKQKAPNDFWDGIRATDCGWEFCKEIWKDRPAMCFSGAGEDDQANWFKGRAEDLNRKYFPPTPPEQPRAPLPPGGGGGGGGRSNNGGNRGGGGNRSEPPSGERCWPNPDGTAWTCRH